MENCSNLYLSSFKNSLFEHKFNFDVFSGKNNKFKFFAGPLFQDTKILISSSKKLYIGDTCSICFNIVKSKASPNCCSHIFCFPCLRKWMKIKPVCPLCRREFQSILKLKSLATK